MENNSKIRDYLIKTNFIVQDIIDKLLSPISDSIILNMTKYNQSIIYPTDSTNVSIFSDYCLDFYSKYGKKFSFYGKLSQCIDKERELWQL